MSTEAGLYILGGALLTVLVTLLIVLMRKGNAGGPGISLTQLGPYRRMTLLSEKGGMAKVYKAYNSEAGRECVLKVLRPEQLGDPEIVKRFRREGEILQTIKQQVPEAPVVNVFTMGTISTQLAEAPFIEMEYIPGDMDLADTIKARGHLTPDEAAKIVAQIIRALAAAHERGVIHRDLKPSNVLLYNGDLERIVVCDFGVAKRVDSKSVTVGGFGTVAYMSPEQCEGSENITPASDIYSLGILWYEMLTGKRLFDDENPFVLMQKHKEDDPTQSLVENAPEQYRFLLSRILEKAQEKRPGLEDILAELPVEALQLQRYDTPPEPAMVKRYTVPAIGGTERVNRTLAVLLSILLAFLLIVMGFEFSKSFQSEKSVTQIKVSTPTPHPTFETIAYYPTPTLGSVAPFITVTPSIPVPAPSAMASLNSAHLTVHPEPADARVRILNISPKFEQGMELEPGRYQIEVSANDYETSTVWIDLKEGEERDYKPILKKQTPAATPAPPTPVPSPAPATETPLSNKAGDETTIVLPGKIPMKFRFIPPGEFVMGSPPNEKGRYADEGPAHKVKITQSFWMSTHEVTNKQYHAFRPEHNSQSYRGFSLNGANQPVVYVSWNDATAFCAWLSKVTQYTFRLPTEAEWEYACRAGTTQRFYWGNDPSIQQIEEYAWYEGNANYQTHNVGQKKPNTWGLRDMSGSVWEWCADWYGAYPEGDQTDPKGSPSGAFHVTRSGSWSVSAEIMRSASRNRGGEDNKGSGLGFRVVSSSPLAEN